MKRYKVSALLLVILFWVYPAFPQYVKITGPTQTSFGTYQPKSRPFVPRVAPYVIPDSLNGVLFADQYNLSDKAIALLKANGFAAIPTNSRKMSDIYLQTANHGLPVFVTTDAPLQTLHIVYDNMLRIAEYEQFFFQLDTMLVALMRTSIPLRDSIHNDSLTTALKRTQALLDVAHTLLTDTITFLNDTSVKNMVVAETTLVAKHTGFSKSNVVTDFDDDFSQYIPRGHYTRDERLQRFFKAMMYLGRMNLRTTNPMETMQACLLVRLMATACLGQTKALDLWKRIYNTTSFMVGYSDDLGYLDYQPVLDSLLGAQWIKQDVNQIFSKRKEISTGLQKLPKPQILSGGSLEQGFRVMGQRFIPDSYAFSQLVYDHVGSRNFPRGLDVFAVLGSQRARQLLINYYHDDTCRNYTNQLDKLTQLFAAKPAAQWVDNCYWSWLYSLLPLIGKTDTGYPMFMTTQAWADKSLSTASGSWAELRHDAILYAKQSYGSVGICHSDAVVAQGYVEPYPEVFARIASLAAYMRNGFENLGFSSILPMNKLTQLDTLCCTLRDIAIKELEGGDIKGTGYFTIANVGRTIYDIENFQSYQIPSSITNSPPDSSTALIADVHTDPNSMSALEVGVGDPMYLYVVAPVEGRLQLCRGAMMSYYEFTQPIVNRLTDEQWQAMLSNHTAPKMPGWIRSFAIDSAKVDRSSILDETNRCFGSVEVGNTFRAGDSIVASVRYKTVRNC